MSETHSKRTPMVALPTFPQGVPLAWAVACGAVSAVGLRWTLPLAGRALAAILLVEFVHRWIVWLLLQGEGRRASAAARAPLFALPYAQPDSPAQRFAAWASDALRFLRSAWASPRGLRARTLGSLVLVGAFLSLGLGSPAAWVGASVVALALVGGLWLRVSPARAGIWTPGLLVALAWACGAATAAGRIGAPLALAPAYGLAAAGLAALDRGADWSKGVFLAGIAAPVAALVAFRMALPAAALGFVAVAGCAVLVPAASQGARLAKAARPLLWLSMALAALALGL